MFTVFQLIACLQMSGNSPPRWPLCRFGRVPCVGVQAVLQKIHHSSGHVLWIGFSKTALARHGAKTFALKIQLHCWGIIFLYGLAHIFTPSQCTSFHRQPHPSTTPRRMLGTNLSRHLIFYLCTPLSGPIVEQELVCSCCLRLWLFAGVLGGLASYKLAANS